MGALSAPSAVKWIEPIQKFNFLAAETATFYAGGLCFIKKGTGGVVHIPVANYNFAGVVTKTVSATSGVTYVEVFTNGMVLLPTGAAITVADEGDLAIMDASGTLSDNPADIVSNLDATGAATDVVIGRIMQAATEGMWIHIGHNICVTNVGWV